MGFVSKVYGLAVHKSRLKTSKRKKRKGAVSPTPTQPGWPSPGPSPTSLAS